MIKKSQHLFNSDAISSDVTMLTRYIHKQAKLSSLPKIALLCVYIYACIPKNGNGLHLVKQTQCQLESSGPCQTTRIPDQTGSLKGTKAISEWPRYNYSYLVRSNSSIDRAGIILLSLTIAHSSLPLHFFAIWSPYLSHMDILCYTKILRKKGDLKRSSRKDN